MPTVEDTRDLLAARMAPPARARHTWMGVCFGFAALLWLAAGVTLILATQGDVLGIVAGFTAIAAGTVTLVAVMLAVSITIWRASSAEHKQLSDELKTVSSSVKVLSEKVKQIDPWTIYTAVSADLLGRDVGPRP